MALTESEKRSDRKEKPLTKVVVRRLPPQMTQEEFVDQVSPVPDHNYLYMVKGDMNLGPYAFSRVYINFTRPDDVFSFKEKFDNYVFLDNKGNEYAAVVEFASFQKVPKKRGKNRMDPKCKTIESDSYFTDFVASLNKTEEQEEKPEYTLQLTEKSNKEEETTPLLEYIKNKKAQKQKIREMRREEREKKRREYESRKREYHKPGYERKLEREDKSFVSKSYSSNKPNKKETEVVEDIKAEKNSEKTDRSERHHEKPSSSSIKPRDRGDRGYEEKRKEIKPRFPKKEYPEHNKKYDDYKERAYKSKYYDENSFHGKQEEKATSKKVKKYSEKREERKMEALKAEQKKLEQQEKNKFSELLINENILIKKDEQQDSPFHETEENKGKNKETLQLDDKGNNVIIDPKLKELEEPLDKTEIREKGTGEKKAKEKDVEVKTEPKKNIEEKTINKSDTSSSSKSRIRNKDRPTIEIYRPGMLSKNKKQSNGDGDSKKDEGDDCSKKSDE